MNRKTSMKVKAIDILLAEDNPADADLTREAFKEARIINRLHHVTDGEEALAFMRREGKYADAPRPDFVILDLNMPRKDGHEVLEAMNEDENLSSIPVMVLTSSREDEDIINAFYHHAKCYSSKPVDMNMFFVTLRDLGDFYWGIVKAPEKSSAENGEEGETED
jgi:CheY-like chemotaxis protein